MTNKVKQLDKTFPVEYVKNGLNGTKAYKALRPNTNNAVAAVASTRLLKKDNVRKSIEALLPSEEKTMQVLREAYEAPKEKSISYKDLHKFWETDLKLRGKLQEKTQGTVNVGIIIKD